MIWGYLNKRRLKDKEGSFKIEELIREQLRKGSNNKKRKWLKKEKDENPKKRIGKQNSGKDGKRWKENE